MRRDAAWVLRIGARCLFGGIGKAVAIAVADYTNIKIPILVLKARAVATLTAIAPGDDGAIVFEGREGSLCRVDGDNSA